MSWFSSYFKSSPTTNSIQPQSIIKTYDNTQHLINSQVTNQTYVGQGSNIEIFTNHNQLISQGQITEIDFEPNQMLLIDQGTKFLMLNPTETTKVYEMDIESGQMIQEYGVNDDWHIRHLAPLEKYRESDPDSQVVAVNNNSVFSLDSRQHGHNKLAICKSYQTPPRFECVVSTKNGYTAVGSRTGEIRLFSEINKPAKSLITGFGDRILGLDTSDDEKWLLVTCDHYLLLISTHNKDLSNNAYQQSYTNLWTTPTKLKLTTSDQQRYQLHTKSLNCAYFDSKNRIVTTIGNYLVIWTFTKGQIASTYQIQSCPQSIVTSQPNYKQNSITMAAQNQLFLL